MEVTLRNRRRHGARKYDSRQKLFTFFHFDENVSRTGKKSWKERFAKISHLVKSLKSVSGHKIGMLAQRSNLIYEYDLCIGVPNLCLIVS